MHTLTSSTMLSPEAPSDRTSLTQIDTALQQLWAEEPVCAVVDRSQVLDELRALTIDVERLEFRSTFHPDEAVDAELLFACRERLGRLLRHWPGASIGTALTVRPLQAVS